MHPANPLSGWISGTLIACAGAAAASTPAELLQSYSSQAATAANPARGQSLFTSRHGQAWSCASCHGDRPLQPGQHAATGRSIAPLAPAAQPTRLTDPAKVEKWFRRNCNDVIGRECSAGEKADLIAWLMSLRP
jgi:mono/diheme cytochrome c family protein